MRKLIPHGVIGAELRAIARDDERAARDERRLGNRLRADLLATFPAALDIASGDLGSAVFLKLLERWPSAADLAAASHDEIEAFARNCRHGWPDRFADQVLATLTIPQLPVRPELARAKAGTIRLAATQLLAIRAQRRVWERRMGQLLLGAPRTGRDKTVKDPDPGKAFPGGEIYLSMPGLGDRLAARIAGEIGEHVGQYATPNALQCYAGRPRSPAAPGAASSSSPAGPPTTATSAKPSSSGRSAASDAPVGPATSTTPRSPPGKSHHTTLRALGNRWLEVLWHCLRLGVTYNETIHTRNRDRALKPAA